MPPKPRRRRRDDPSVALLLQFYADIEPEYANVAKVQKIIGSFQRKAAKAGAADWREAMYTDIAKKHGIDPREHVAAQSGSLASSGGGRGDGEGAAHAALLAVSPHGRIQSDVDAGLGGTAAREHEDRVAYERQHHGHRVVRYTDGRHALYADCDVALHTDGRHRSATHNIPRGGEPTPASAVSVCLSLLVNVVRCYAGAFLVLLFLADSLLIH
eukprot:COSAG02_NODE_3743_length_6299_cov_27.086452_2_plen_214_part_00